MSPENAPAWHWTSVVRLTCPPSRRCWVPERPLPTTARCSSCSWCQSSWRRTSPGPEWSSDTRSWPLPCSRETNTRINMWHHTQIIQTSWIEIVLWSMSLFCCDNKVSVTYFSMEPCSWCQVWILSCHCSLDSLCCFSTLRGETSSV